MKRSNFTKNPKEKQVKQSPVGGKKSKADQWL